jgi:hypothetical protein
MSQVRNVTARFDVVTQLFNLNVTANNGGGSGTVTGGPIACTITGANITGTCSAPVNQGTIVNLTAAAQGGSTFDSWGGDCSGTQATCQVTMSAVRNVTARFIPQTVALTVASLAGSMAREQSLVAASTARSLRL